MNKTPVQIERPELWHPESSRSRFGVGDVWTLVKGTWRGAWADPGSDFRIKVLDAAGVTVGARVDFWTSNLGGLPRWVNPWSAGSMADWKIGGDFLAEVLEKLPLEQRNILTHSHGLQPGAFAAAQIPINRFVSISGPVRGDLDAVYKSARKHITHWTQVYDKDHDQTQWSGELFGGVFGPRVAQLYCADRNVPLVGVGHSGLFQPAHYALWGTERLLGEK